jgi:hypothetical protein
VRVQRAAAIRSAARKRGLRAGRLHDPQRGSMRVALPRVHHASREQKRVRTLGGHAGSQWPGERPQRDPRQREPRRDETHALRESEQPRQRDEEPVARDYCGKPFDRTVPETRDSGLLRAFWYKYCPEHRLAPAGQIIITESR